MIRLFRVFIPTSVVALLVSETCLILSCYLLATWWVLQFQVFDEFLIYLWYESGLLRTALVALSAVLGFYSIDLYSEIKVVSRIRLLQDLCQVMGIALLSQGLISYALPPLRLGRGIMLYGSLLTMIALFGWRMFYSTYVVPMMGTQRLLFVGASPVVREMADHILAHPQKGISIAGYLVNPESASLDLPGGAVLGEVRELRRIAEETKPDRIVIGLAERRDRLPMQDLLELRFAGFLIEEAGVTYEAVCGRISTKNLRPSQLIFSGELGPRPASLAFQTLMNYTLSLLGAIMSLPLTIAVAVAVKLSSPGPIFYRQTRVGRNGAPFVVYKFRSMRADAEADTGAVWASKDDPRVTRAGKWLRRLRLDELPQFFNVLRGEMSLVGPRPERPEFDQVLAEKIPYYRQRHCVKPGITGWAQINHKYGDTLEDTIQKLEYDLYYIKHISPSFDAFIIFHTLKTMILSRGAQ
ncbi:MAG: sugar transferase [Acidobacteria bacterium]|nr:sugar transferase [Acidobacteriota bacterium]MBI3473896.1 sugar transferase [Candidatus Solibacter usitatus]